MQIKMSILTKLKQTPTDLLFQCCIDVPDTSHCPQLCLWLQLLCRSCQCMWCSLCKSTCACMSITQPPFSCEVEMSIIFIVIIIVQSWSRSTYQMHQITVSAFFHKLYKCCPKKITTTKQTYNLWNLWSRQILL